MSRRAFLALAVVLALLVFSISAEAASPVLPCQRSLTKSFKMANDWTCPLGGPSLDTVDIVLDCDHHSIKGPGSGMGIVISADRAVVKNCDVSEFKVGVVMKGLSMATLQDSRVRDNEIGLLVERVRDARVSSVEFVQNTKSGIHSKGAYLTSLQNFFAGNAKDITEIDPIKNPPAPEQAADVTVDSVEATLPSARTQASSSAFSAPEVGVFDNRVTENMISSLGLDSEKHLEVSRSLDVRKAFRLDGSDIVFSTVISAGQRTDGIVIYEIIPKSLTDSPFDVVSPVPHEVAGYDPVVMKFFVGQLGRAEEFQILYTIIPEGAGSAQSRIQDSYPSSIVYTESPVAWQPLIWVEWIFVLFVMLFALWIFEDVVTASRRILVNFIIAFAVTLFFLAYDLDLFVLVDREVHLVAVAVVLFSACLFYGSRAWLLYVKANAVSQIQSQSRPSGRPERKR